MRPSFLKLLDRLPDMAFDLLVALRTEGVAMRLMSATGGLGPTLCNFEVGGRPHGRHLEELESDPHVDEISNAAMWLFSLYRKKTAEANERTVAWIREWMKNGWTSRGLAKEEAEVTK